MRRWSKIALGIGVTAAVIAGLAYFNRTSLALALVHYRAGQAEVGPNRPIAWQRGPAEAAEAQESATPPNIVFILFDDLGINDISTFGGGVAGGRVPTPNIDRLAAEGAIFSTAYAGNATCAPSRAQLMTGRYSTRTGFEYTPTPNGFGRLVAMATDQIRGDLPRSGYNAEVDAAAPSFADQGLPSEEVTIAEVLKARGYHTVHIGKWHLGNGKGFHPNDQGFDESLMMESGLHLPEDHPDVVNAKVDFDPIDRFLWASMRFATSYNRGPWFAPGRYLADYWTDESLKVIEANRNRPFFLYLAHWGVHTPLQATRADYEAVGAIGSERHRVHAAMVRSLDRSVGRIMAKLEEEGLADNTLIVISSDNGGAGYIGVPDVNAPYRGFKISFFEGGIRVPLFLRWPARIRPGTKAALPVGHVDVMPTLAAASGSSLPGGVAIDGRNLLPAATGSGAVERADAPLFWNSGYYKVVRAGDWKLQVNEKQGKSWLYDLASDPTEKVNLIGKRPDKRVELAALLASHHRGRKAPLYPSVLDGSIMIDKTLAERFEPGDEFIYWPN
ncbi:Arylsulfatase [Tsuneonella dongtanensis]|uniref:Arylsulfatase n=1 Tax=Tsuneonella dongtanensis TaxID=692370 RepID=A0A1B2AB25_9SPHN|nr:sulfatase-like hydrolase/transferase [Tsuneonella dongtanensis]ANY19373.1 Arylsulfatase [Tsuneonella dongtanensis]